MALAKLTQLLDGIEESAFGLREFTGLFPLRPQTTHGRERLHRELSELDAASPSPLWAARGVHQARLILIEHPKLHASEAASEFSFGPLVLSFVHEGDLIDVLNELLEQCGSLLDRLLGYCQGYPGLHDARDATGYLLSARVKSGFFFRDREASRTEILRALELRRRFLDFVVHAQTQPASALAENFRRFQEGRWPSQAAARGNAPRDPQSPRDATRELDLALAYDYPLAPAYERPIARERFWVRRTAELARARLRRETREARQSDPSAPARRGVHAKHHGLVLARVTVRPDLPRELQHGVFIPGRSYQAYLRFSNAAERVQHDDVPDARGVALKLLDVGACGRPVLEQPLPDGFETRGQLTQDFVLVSHPRFFVKDARDYAIFRGVLDTRSGLEQAARAGLFGLRRPRELAIFMRALLRVIDHPFAIEYHSMTASLCGPAQAIKYCLHPLRPGQFRVNRPSQRFPRERDHLREAMQRGLDRTRGKLARLELSAIVPPAEGLSVEDPRVDWERAGARRVALATIDIEPQEFCDRERMRLAESMVFTPWHTLEQHRPLGSLNRARLEVYRAGAAERRALNGIRHDASAPTVVDSSRARSGRDSDEAGGERQRRSGRGRG